LIFHAALSLRWSELRRDLSVILVLATAGVLVSAAIAAAGMHAFAQWPWLIAVTFGILIAATDPVSVIATFREAGVQGGREFVQRRYRGGWFQRRDRRCRGSTGSRA
jgi:CPA1 family monovalent cation:H+ antiporter